MINWIASYPKSGNTWVRLFLSAYITGDLDINRDGVTSFDQSKYLFKSLSPGDIHYERKIYLRPAVLLHLVESRRYDPLMVKTHWANVVQGGITMIPRPLTKSAVYLVRDPRDVCVSFARHLGKSIDDMIVEMDRHQTVLMDKHHQLASSLTTWSEHVESWERDFVTIIKYEDLKEDPEKWFRQILESFGIKVNLQRMRKAINLCDLKNLKKQENKKGFFVEKGQAKRFFGQGKGWENELTEKQIRRIEEDHADVMAKYGYKPYKRLKAVKGENYGMAS